MKGQSFSYLVVATKSWNSRIFRDIIRRYPGNWNFIGTKEELTAERIKEISPRFIFFIHWSWKVPIEIVNDWECVCFHMTNVPYGRGGSPLQNLIVRGHSETRLTALRMVEEFDAGPVYFQRDLSLEGSAEEIYIRGAELAGEMIQDLITNDIVPSSQEGTPTIFKRRKPNESEIPLCGTLKEMYNFIRMLDAEGYPKSYLSYKGFRFEFSGAVRYEGRLMANVSITHES
jgi:methionyl-tRNA formyltransferase